MAYNPHTQYRGDMYLYQAITNLGEKAGEALTNYRKDRAESQFLEQQMQGLMDSARQHSNLVRLDDPQVAKALEDEVTDLGKFGGMSLAQKRGKVAALNFQLNQLMKVGESQRANRYLGLQEENVALGRRREEREVAEAAGQRQAQQRFMSEVMARTRDPAGRNFNIDQDASGAPRRQPTVNDLLAAGAAAGGRLDPRIMGQVGQLLQANNQWNLAPGQTFDFGENIRGVATSPGGMTAFNTTPRTLAGQAATVTETSFDPETGNTVTTRRAQTPEELRQAQLRANTAAAGPMPEGVKALVDEHLKNRLQMAQGNKRGGWDWTRLGQKFLDRNVEIERILREVGYDQEGRLLTVAQGPNATAASVQPAPSLAQPVFENLPLGGQTNWGGANIRFKGRKE